MQILKEDIRIRILENAESMFLQHGFSGSSTRELAKKVGISYSNLYRYFDSKNALFEALIEPYYVQLMATLNKLLAHSEQANSTQAHTAALISVFSGLIEADRKKFIILMEGSRGTRFEGLRSELVNVIENRIRESLNNDISNNQVVIKLLAENFFNGILAVAKAPANEEYLRADLEMLVIYHLGGIEKLAAL